MKKINKWFKVAVVSMLVVCPQMVGATKYIVCGNNRTIPYTIANIFSTLLTIIKIAIPILLVITGMISFIKVVSSSNADDDMKKAQKKLLNNIIAAVVIFFIVSIVNFVVGLVAGSGNSAMKCVRCLIDLDKCEIEEKSSEIKPGFINDVEKETANGTNTGVNNSSTASLTNENNKTLDDFLFIGDSRYVGIEEQLKSFGNNIRVEAIVGASASSWMDSVSSFANHSDKISVMLGINETNSDKMIKLLEKIHDSNANAKIYVNSVYHIGTAYKSGYVTNSDVDNFNSAIKAYCDSNNWLVYIDVTQDLYESNGYLKAAYTSDGLHMNNNGNEILVNNIKRELVK